MVGILLHVIDRPETSGRYNAVSPGIVTNRQFIEALARRLRRCVLWSIPEWLVRRLVGDERSSILLRGLVAGICLLPPTFLMGASLPAIGRWVESTADGV